MLIRLLVITLVPFYRAQVRQSLGDVFSRAELEEWTDRKRLYALFTSKQSSIYDVKAKLEEELGLPFDDTQVYFDNKLLDQTAYLEVLHGPHDLQDSILTVICSGKPTLPFN